MLVGVLQFEVFVPGAESLKDKRRVVRSLKDRLHREHMVSVAEVGRLDDARVAWMGLAVVSNSGRHIGEVFDRVLRKVRATPGAELGEVSREILSGDQLPGDAVGEDGAPLWTDAERREPGEPASRSALGEAA